VRGERQIYLAFVEHFIKAALFLSPTSAPVQTAGHAKYATVWIVTSAEQHSQLPNNSLAEEWPPLF